MHACTQWRKEVSSSFFHKVFFLSVLVIFWVSSTLQCLVCTLHRVNCSRQNALGLPNGTIVSASAPKVQFFPSHSGEWEKGFLYLDWIFQGVAEIWWIIGLDGWETNWKLIVFHPLQGFKALKSSGASASKNPKKIYQIWWYSKKVGYPTHNFFLRVFPPQGLACPPQKHVRSPPLPRKVQHLSYLNPAHNDP